MNTPIYDFLRGYCKSDMLRLHMPGHKGRGLAKPFPEICGFDITETDGAGDLYSTSGIIAESEENASRLYGTAQTFFSAGGSTLCIQTMLKLAAPSNGRVLAGRNCHKAFLNAAALLGLTVDWVYPKRAGEGELYGGIVPEELERALCASRYDCVYITSVNYYGYIENVRAIAEICHRHGIALLCDNAHGAHLAFTRDYEHPIAAGADMCCDSAHKTLPALTGAAYLHLREKRSACEVKQAMSLFGSTSPSYLIMLSLDMLGDFLEKECRGGLDGLIDRISLMKTKLSSKYRFCGDDPLHVTINAAYCGADGRNLAHELRRRGIACEYCDRFCVVLLFSATNTQSDADRLENALADIEFTRCGQEIIPYFFPSCHVAMPMRDALFSEADILSPREAMGRICARPVIPCPPAFPLIAAGEIITDECAGVLERFGVSRISVIRKDN